MPKIKELTGNRYGRLTAKNQDGRSNDGKVLWSCLCDCGKKSTVRSSDLIAGKVVSCGCLHRENIAGRNFKHGKSKSKTYKVWAAMIQRCANKNNINFYNYGGRGIGVCDRWLDFSSFFADMGDAPKNLSIERNDVNGHYELGNCKWATMKEQQNNKRNNILISVNGDVVTAEQAGELTGINARKIRSRISAGCSLDRAIIDADLRTIPYRKSAYQESADETGVLVPA